MSEDDMVRLRACIDAVPLLKLVFNLLSMDRIFFLIVEIISYFQTVNRSRYICLDVANGYSEHFVNFVRRVREQFDKHTILAGNVVTGEMVEELILTGADIIKVARLDLYW